MRRFKKPSRAAVAKSLRDLRLIWAKPPPDAGQDKAAGAGTEAAKKKAESSAKFTLDHSEPQRGRA